MMLFIKILMNVGLCLILAIGKMKDEVRGKIINEFVVLKSKLFQFSVDGGKLKKQKISIKNIVNSIRHKKFVDVLLVEA